MQLKQAVSAVSALASLLQGLPLSACEEVGAAAAGRQLRSPPWPAPARSLGLEQGLEQGCLSWPEKVAV